MDEYGDVVSAAASCLWLDVDAFIGRLPLAIDPKLPLRAAAGIVESAREVLVRRCLATGLDNEEALLLEKAVRNTALARLGEHPVGTYLLAIFGRRINRNTHPDNV